MEKQKERLIELIRKSGCVDTWNYNTDDFKEPNPIEKLADHLLANGVIVPPCKVGDTVCWLDNEKIKSDEVFEISIHSDGILVHTGIQFCLSQVFLTKEDAQQALRKDEGK